MHIYVTHTTGNIRQNLHRDELSDPRPHFFLVVGKKLDLLPRDL